MITDTALVAFQVSTVATPLITVLGVASNSIAGCVLRLFCEDIDPPPHPMPAIKIENKKTNMGMRGTNRMGTASKLKCAVDQGTTCVA
jgi:hypothetical protein